MTSNEDLVVEYIQTRDLSQNTHYTIRSKLNHYSNFQGLSLQELIDEADQEEEEGVRWKKRKLKTRLINYINYCKQYMKISSVKTYLSVVKSFYYYHEIEIYHLPPINHKNAEVSEPITYKDLPDKEIIRYAYELSIPVMRAVILFLASTGMSKVDALKLTIQDFIEATQEYHNEDNIDDVLRELRQYEDSIIPTWNNRRAKTNKYYVSFNTPECTDEILNYLELRQSKEKLQSSDQLFKISGDYYTIQFQIVNDIMGLGKVGAYNRFRGHMLRKFHASNLKKAGMDRYQINVLQGKSNNSVDEVYFFEDIDKLKEDYIQYMDCLLIFTDVKEVTKYSPEYLSMVEENNKLKAQVEKVEQLEQDILDIKSWYIFDDE